MNKKDLFLKMVGVTPYVLIIGMGIYTVKLGYDRRKLRKKLKDQTAVTELTDVLLISALDRNDRDNKLISRLKAENQELKSNLAVKKK